MVPSYAIASPMATGLRRAADRYGVLIRQALRDVQAAPTRPGAKARPDLAPGAYVYHLTFSRL